MTTISDPLRVAGKAKVPRGGRTTVLKGKYHTDITVAGRLAARSIVKATLQTHRSRVAIATIRLTCPRRQGQDLPGQGRLDHREHLRRLVRRGVLSPGVRPVDLGRSGGLSDESYRP